MIGLKTKNQSSKAVNLFFSYFTLLCAYLIGSFPTGWLIARAKGIKNIRKHGSGNIGATNVARFLGVRYFFLIFLIDCFKSFGALWFLSWLGSSEKIIFFAAGALLLGNTRSVFLNFTGGKGVATTVGLFLFLFPQVLAVVFPVWIAVFIGSRNIGLASVVALFSAPFSAFFMGASTQMLLFVAIAAQWCIFLHRDNIRKWLRER